ncbi:histidinolphosphatase [Arthrobotrys musiformis]|uniref:Histidinol-phosphatase n=1 Tax=Arthrobotrys musiformis TaxID=47236 RepID=A0AAV9WBB5_9PEZI
MPFSHHSHSGQFCAHAKDSLESCILQAISKNLRVFCLTEHMPRADPRDFYPEELELGITPQDEIERFAEFYKTAVALRDKYKEEISIFIGFEVDYVRPSMLSEIKKVQETYHFDMFIGSVHHVDEIPIDFSEELFNRAIEAVEAVDAGADIAEAYHKGTKIERFPQTQVTEAKGEERLFEVYFDTQYEMLTALKPPVIGHFDLIRLKCKDYKLDFQSMKNVWDKIVRNVKFISEYGGMVEINSAATRKGWEYPYPGPDILQLMKAEGVRFVLSDDSHGIAQVAFGYEKSLAYLEKQGVEEVWYYGWIGWERGIKDGILRPEDRYLPKIGPEFVETKSARVKDLRGIVPP